MRIIFRKPPNNTVTILCPSPNWIAPSTKTEDVPDGKRIKDLTTAELPVAMEELAQKDVPTGLKYKIVEDSDIPTDRTFRDAWEIEESELTDGVGA
jgi:hypothetical protein